MRSPYSLITSSRQASANWRSVTGHDGGAGRFVTRYHVVRSGNVCGSVVATTARSVLSGPYGPATNSSAHPSFVLPPRNLLLILPHWPGCSVSFLPAPSGP